MKLCALCKKGSNTGGKRAFLRSHYNPAKTLRKYPNLQWMRLASGKRVKVCTGCLKTASKKL